VRELHVVAVSEDGRHVLLGATKNASKGTYRVRLDARLVSAVRGDLGVTHERDLSPKEIQARLRAGESAEQIARAAGMPVTRVERFAGPVAGERLRMIEGAREAYVVRGRLGRSAQPLGRAVDTALGAATEAASWSARREDDGRWCVQVSWTARGRNRTASWRYEPHDRSLEAVDPGSAALAHVAGEQEPRPAARRPAPVPAAPSRAAAPAAPTKAPAARTTAKKAPVKKATATKAAAKAPAKAPTKKAATRTAAKKAAPAKNAPATKAPAKTAAKRTAVKRTAATRTAAKTTPVKKAASRVAPAKKAPVHAPKKAARPRLQVVPDPPRTPPKAAPKAADERDGVRSRASVPAWADVLLGTTPSNDQ
jgi:hypothetical protein